MGNEQAPEEPDEYLTEHPEPHADSPSCEHGGGNGGIACVQCHGGDDR